MDNILKGKFVIVSNRLPMELETRAEDNSVTIKPSSGGLVTALTPILKKHEGIWIGWDGDLSGQLSPDMLDDESASFGYCMKPVSLTPQEIHAYYDGFCNETLWPLFHDYLGRAEFHRSTWQAYQNVNLKFAQHTARFVEKDDIIWIQDYHLIMVGKYMRELGFQQKLVFFLHIPFPPWDIFMRLPWRKEIIEGFLCYDIIGFQTIRDYRNFIQCIRRLIPEHRIIDGKRNLVIEYSGKKITLGAFPISIDFNEFNNLAKTDEVAREAWYIHENLPNRKIILGVDRLDYTKGILRRLLAFETLLEEFPATRGKVSLVQILVPSRMSVSEYQRMKQNIEEMIGRINGRFTVRGWIPIHYIYRSLPRKELVAYYRTSEIALITPLKDGMNLVAKEYCASCISENGVLILSEFAGAALQLGKNAILVNPYNVEHVAEMIHLALNMPLDERKIRMRRLRNIVRRNNIYVWMNNFLKVADLRLMPDN
jgi:trehalose 6-phosphate synthase/phosphatase